MGNIKKWFQFINENNTYIDTNELHYVIPEDEFKNLGYRYQELFASDIPHYIKKLKDGYTIWCNANDKSVIVNDWYDFLTPTIINYYLENKNGENVKYSKTFDYHYITTRLNRQTGEIIVNNYKLDDKYLDTPWHELIIPIESFGMLVDELNKITDNKFIK